MVVSNISKNVFIKGWQRKDHNPDTPSFRTLSPHPATPSTLVVYAHRLLSVTRTRINGSCSRRRIKPIKRFLKLTQDDLMQEQSSEAIFDLFCSLNMPQNPSYHIKSELFWGGVVGRERTCRPPPTHPLLLPCMGFGSIVPWLSHLFYVSF